MAESFPSRGCAGVLTCRFVAELPQCLAGRRAAPGNQTPPPTHPTDRWDRFYFEDPK